MAIHGNYMLKERTCNFHVIIREFVINFIFNNSDIFGGISLNPIILRLIINPWKNCLYSLLNKT